MHNAICVCQNLFFLIFLQHLQRDLRYLIMYSLRPNIHLGSTLIRPRIYKNQAMASWSHSPKNHSQKAQTTDLVLDSCFDKPLNQGQRFHYLESHNQRL